MKPDITLRGMTWSDPRGYDPLAAAATAFSNIHPGVTITWDKRSLQGFESTPVEELAAAYDLMIIDHPHVGAVVEEACLLPFDTDEHEEELAVLAGQTLGKSFESYRYAGRQWALPVDAAAQVQAIRPDRLDEPVKTWTEVVSLARAGQAVWPLRPPHNLMSFFTLMANVGAPCAVRPGRFADEAAAEQVLEALKALADLVDPACHGMDPIAALDALTSSQTLALAPHTYLYKGYANAGYRPHRVAFHDIPALGKAGPLGSALGGTGLAISARTRHPDLCKAFCFWVASAQVQSGLYTTSNGQPGNAAAWNSEAVNEPVGDAYFNTRMTHEAAWLRPRHRGYMGFQEEGSHILTDILKGTTTVQAGFAALTARFNDSFDRS